MRGTKLIRWLAASVASGVAGIAMAATITVTFPEANGPANPSGPFPAAALPVASQTFQIPSGQHVVGATISGSWGSSGDPNSTAGVQVYVDDILVAECDKPDPQCYQGNVGQRPWSYTFKDSELWNLDDGVATLTAVQTSDLSVRLGVSTLVIETAPSPIVPTLSTLGLAALVLAMTAAGVLAAHRRRRG